MASNLNHALRPRRALPRLRPLLGPTEVTRAWPQVRDVKPPTRNPLKRNRGQESHVSSHIPNRHHRTNPTPPDEELRVFRTNPTPRDQSDRLLPLHNPSVVGSIPTSPTPSPPSRYERYQLQQ